MGEKFSSLSKYMQIQTVPNFYMGIPPQSSFLNSFLETWKTFARRPHVRDGWLSFYPKIQKNVTPFIGHRPLLSTKSLLMVHHKISTEIVRLNSYNNLRNFKYVKSSIWFSFHVSSDAL